MSCPIILLDGTIEENLKLSSLQARAEDQRQYIKVGQPWKVAHVADVTSLRRGGIQHGGLLGLRTL